MQLAKGRYTAVDRYASVNKSKPKNLKPERDFGDNDLEIYDGDSFSVYKSHDNSIQKDGFNNQSVEYEVVEEVYQSINTSNIPDGVIEEASIEESSNEILKNKRENHIDNFKKYVKNYTPETQLNIQTGAINSNHQQKEVPSSIKNLLSSKESNKEKNRFEYNNFIKGTKFNPSGLSYQSEYEKYRAQESKSLLENKETAESPDLQCYTEEKRNNYLTHDVFDSGSKIDNLQGDLDTLSRIDYSNHKKKENVRTDCNTSFEKYVSEQIKKANDFKSWSEATQQKNYK